MTLLGGVSDINKKCVALSQEQYGRSIELLRNGFMLEGVLIKPNERIATIEVLQATLGLRLGDVLRLKLSSFNRSFVDFDRGVPLYDVNDITNFKGDIIESICYLPIKYFDTYEGMQNHEATP